MWFLFILSQLLTSQILIFLTELSPILTTFTHCQELSLFAWHCCPQSHYWQQPYLHQHKCHRLHQWQSLLLELSHSTTYPQHHQKFCQTPANIVPTLYNNIVPTPKNILPTLYNIVPNLDMDINVLIFDNLSPILIHWLSIVSCSTDPQGCPLPQFIIKNVCFFSQLSRLFASSIECQGYLLPCPSVDVVCFNPVSRLSNSIKSQVCPCVSISKMSPSIMCGRCLFQSHVEVFCFKPVMMLPSIKWWPHGPNSHNKLDQ